MQELIMSDSPERYAAEYEKLSHAVEKLKDSATEDERANWLFIIKLLVDRLYDSVPSGQSSSQSTPPPTP